mmetsp:Transcript_115045/g.321527  ORF Transcript_115045/g.321527 Transcript_115045/m.321527 type:complete len:376 (-) Transcript_115045:87-1214(-)
MSCCWARGAERLLPPSKNSDFDRMLHEGFEKAERSGAMSSSPINIERRCLSGTLGLVAQYSPEHYSKKRRPTCSAVQVVAPRTDDAFNFSKARPAEHIGDIEVCEGGVGPGSITTVLANISPLAAGHVLLVPSCEQLLPQVLTEEHFLTGLRLLAKSARHDFRLVFNSLMAFATVNHFHWHGLYLSQCGLADGRLPVEKVERSVVAGAITEGRVSIELLVESQWYVRGFVVSAGCRAGTPGDHPPADLQALASLAHRVVAELQRRNVPHSVILAPPSERRRKQAATSGMAHEEQAKPNALTPEVYILPRQREGNLRGAAGFNAAVMEVSGLIVAHTEEVYKALTEDGLKGIFRDDVSMPEAVFDDLICKMAWLPS